MWCCICWCCCLRCHQDENKEIDQSKCSNEWEVFPLYLHLNQCRCNNIWTNLEPRSIWWWLNYCVHVLENTMRFSATSLILPIALYLIAVQWKKFEIKIKQRKTFQKKLYVTQIRRKTYRAFSICMWRSGQFAWKHWFSVHFGQTRSWPNALLIFCK